MLLKPILETTFGTDTIVLSSAIWHCRRREKRKNTTVYSLGFYVKMKKNGQPWSWHTAHLADVLGAF